MQKRGKNYTFKGRLQRVMESFRKYIAKEKNPYELKKKKITRTDYMGL